MIYKATHYHVHVYYKLEQMEEAKNLREQFIQSVPEIEGVGSLRKTEVGPHPLPMFEAWFAEQAFQKVYDFFQVRRGDFSVMFHPLSGDDLEDHRDHAIWLGESLPLKLDQL